MAVRRLLRGQVPWETLESLGVTLAERYEESTVRLEFLDVDNWLSTPFVLNEEYFVKVITDQHAFLHALLTTGRNLGAVTAGMEAFFESFEDPVAMAEHELEATRRIREVGVNAPRPVEAFAHQGVGVLVLEYLPSFEALDAVGPRRAEALAPDLFAALATIHQAGLAHGDLRAANVLVTGGDLYFIDATRVDPDAIDGARAYDVASALAALEPLIGSDAAVRAAATAYDPAVLQQARGFLDFVRFRPDHAFDAGGLKTAIAESES